MKRTILVLMVGVLLALGAVPATAGRGPTVTVLQYGQESSAVDVANYFSVKGEGFRTFSPAWVCLALCEQTDVDSVGSFAQTRRLDEPGTYLMQVYQWRNRSAQRSELVYSGYLTVKN